MSKIPDILKRDMEVIFGHIEKIETIAKHGIPGKTIMMPPPKLRDIPGNEKLLRLYMLDKDMKPVMVAHDMTLLTFGAAVLPFLKKPKFFDDEIIRPDELAGSLDRIEQERREGKWQPKDFFVLFVFIGPTLSHRRDLSPEEAKELAQALRPLGVRVALPDEG